MSLRHVIIGTGEAGIACATALRQAGHRSVVLVGMEPVAPYERPALSKPRQGFHQPMGADLSGLDFRRDARAIAIHRGQRFVELSTGLRLHYDRLLLATGAQARGLACDGSSRALGLRTLADAQAIYARATPGARVVIIGAGLIGLELAAQLVSRLCVVTVLETGPRAMGRAVPEGMATAITDRHRAAGVQMHFGTTVQSIHAAGVICADGAQFPADLVIAAIGAKPDVELAQSAGLACDNGILTDDRLATDDPAIFAAGDCARLDHPRYGRMRFESWRMACDQGTFAAAAMVGDEAKFDALPWFWSDQYDLGFQAVGLHDPSRPAVLRKTTDAEVRFECDPTGTLVAAQGLGSGNAVARDIKLAELLIARGVICAPDWLADPGANLKSALRAA